jgi:stage V sporulation protein K
LLDNGADVHHKEAEGYTALAIASKAGHADTVLTLLRHRADIHARNARKDTALLLASAKGRVDVVKILLDAGSDPNVCNNDGASPLLMSAWSASLPICQSLVKAKADVNFRSQPRGDTALILAGYKAATDVVEWLVSQGVRVDTQNTKGTSVFTFNNPAVVQAVERGTEVLVQAQARARAAAAKPSNNNNNNNYNGRSPSPPAPAPAPAPVKPVSRVPIPVPAPAPSRSPASVVSAASSPSSNHPPGSVEAFMEEEFSKIVGIDGVKTQLRAFYKKVQLDRIREQQPGSRVEKNRLYHMIFMGPPGTGKTTVARLVASVMLKMGLLKTDNVVMVNNALDLVAGYVGQTPAKVDAKVKEAEGGVLFIDEAYSIVKKEGKDTFGREAIDTIMKHMDPPSCVFILAGYERQMNEFLDCNEGLTRRIPYRYHFHPYNVPQLGEILRTICRVKDEDLEEGCVERCTAALEQNLTLQQRQTQNAGLINNWISFAQSERDGRIDLEDARRNPDLASLLCYCDFEAALPAVKNMAQK